jgi:pyrroline-5-carboxylate reductase
MKAGVRRPGRAGHLRGMPFGGHPKAASPPQWFDQFPSERVSFTLTRLLELLETRMALEQKIGFLGAGKMASALAKGFVKSGLVTSGDVRASDPLEEARNSFAEGVRGGATDSNREILEFADVVFLAVKPGQAEEVLSGIRGDFSGRHLLISIAAGVPLRKLEGSLGEGARVIRAMPNTPALVGAGATAYALGRSASKEDGALAASLFSSAGITYEVKEPMLDAVTGLSGSGPAYVCLIIEALSDGGVAAGLPRSIATSLAAQTVLGGARMVLETGLHPGALKDMVTSPGGTTIEGLHELEKAGLRSALISAVRAATLKSQKLGEQ